MAIRSWWLKLHLWVGLSISLVLLIVTVSGALLVWEDDIDRALGLMTGRGDTFIARRAQEVAERCLYHTGRIEASFALDVAEYGRLTELGQVGLLPPLVQSMAVLQQLLGDWTAARGYAQECVDLVDQGEEVWRDRAIMARARILAWEGDLDAARELAREGLARQEAAGDTWEAAIFCALLGFIELSVPDPPAALRHLVATAEHAERLAKIVPDARVEWIDDSYSFVSEDQPGRLAELITGFVRQPAGVA